MQRSPLNFSVLSVLLICVKSQICCYDEERQILPSERSGLREFLNAEFLWINKNIKTNTQGKISNLSCDISSAGVPEDSSYSAFYAQCVLRTVRYTYSAFYVQCVLRIARSTYSAFYV